MEERGGYMAIAEERRRRSDGRHRPYAIAIGLLGSALSLTAFWIHRVAPGSRLATAMDGPPALVVGIAFTAMAVLAVWHYGRRLAEQAVASHDLHRAVVQHERSEAALRESERFVRATVDAMDAMIAVLDADGVIMSVNRAWRLHGGEDPAGPPGLGDVGTNYLAACESVDGAGTADAQRLADAIRQVSSGARGEVFLECVQPETRRVFRSRAARFPGHGPIRVVVSHHEMPADVQPIVHTVLAPPPPPPAPPEDAFDALAEDVPVAVFRADADGTLAWANAAFAELVGAGEGNTVAQRWRDAVHSDDEERVGALCARVLDGGTPGAANLRIRRADGALRACLLHVHAVPAGRGLIGTLLDLTDAHDREAELEASHQRVRAADERAARGERFRLALESAPDGVFLCDVTGRCRLGGGAWRRLAAASDDGGEPAWPDVVHPDDRAAVLDAWRHAIAGDGEIDAEVRLDVGAEPERWVHLRVERLGDDGEFVGWGRDVTAHRAASASLRAQLAALSEEVDTRTRERDRLQLALHEASEADGAARERANEARRHAEERMTELTAAVAAHATERDAAQGATHVVRAELETAHGELAEARSRLAAAATELDAVRAERDAAAAELAAHLAARHDEPLRALDRVVRALADGDDASDGAVAMPTDEQAARVALLTDAVVDLTRAGRGPLTRGAVDMQALAEDVVRDLRRARGTGAPAVAIEELAPATGDVGLLRQVFAHLIENAFKSTRAAAHPCIDVGSVLADGQRVYYVRDNGVGFDGERADQLFRVFERLHPPAEFDGAGVGLAVVRRIVARHGGRVWGEGRVGEGATFYFTLGETVDAV